MARTKNIPLAPADMPEILPAVTARIEAAQNAAMGATEKEELMDLGRRLGQMDAATLFGNISDGILLSAYENVKKSKAWKSLRNKKGEIFPSLEEFCSEQLGYSSRRLAQISSNVGLLGQHAYEQAESIGLRQVDYNAIKSLPAPDQELVRRAVEEAQSREEVIGLIEELATRSARQRIDADKALTESKAEHAATSKRLEVVSKQKDDAEARAARIAVTPPDEALAELQQEATGVMNDALGAIRGGLRNGLVALQDHDQDNGPFMAGLVSQLQIALQTLRDEFNLPDTVGDGTPAWKAWNAQQDGSALQQ